MLNVCGCKYICMCGLLRRSPHPYLFFNDDGNSFTFMGFIIDRQTGDILDPHTRDVLTANALPRQLLEALERNKVNLNENFDQLPRYVQFFVLSFLLMSVVMVLSPHLNWKLLLFLFSFLSTLPISPKINPG